MRNIVYSLFKLSQRSTSRWIIKLFSDTKLSQQMSDKGKEITKFIDWRKINEKFLELMQ